MPKMSKRLTIAITGTIGSGKSTVCSYLRKKGFSVDDCDEINRQLLLSGQPGYQKVTAAFKGVTNDKGAIDHKALADIVFNDQNKLTELQNIMHPLIKAELTKGMDQEVYLAEVPLLFETDFYRLFNCKVLIVCDENIAINRLKERGFDEEMAKARIKKQMPVEEKIRRSDYIIYNNGTEDDLFEQVDHFLEEVKLC